MSGTSTLRLVPEEHILAYKKEIEELKKEIEQLKLFHEWNNQATLKWNDAKDEIEKLKKENEKLKKENEELGWENTYMKNVPCPPVDENEKLKKEIEELKKKNGISLDLVKHYKCKAEYHRDEQHKAVDEIEKLKKEKEELERFNDRLEEKIEKIQDPVLHDRDIRGDNFDIRVCYGYIQECIERITGEYDDGELDDSVYREVAQAIDAGINNFVKNGTIGSIQELECAITEAIEKEPVYKQIVKEE